MTLADHRWTLQPESNILAAENLARADRALKAGWLCGMHYYYAGGRGGDAIAFAQYAEYLAYLHAARPGDLFLLWSISRLRDEGELLMGVRFDSQVSESHARETGIDVVLRYLQTPTNEVLAVAAVGGASPRALQTDAGGSNWARFLEMLDEARQRGGEMYVLPFTLLDQPGRYFLRAKRPNERGEVPLGGAY